VCALERIEDQIHLVLVLGTVGVEVTLVMAPLASRPEPLS